MTFCTEAILRGFALLFSAAFERTASPKVGTELGDLFQPGRRNAGPTDGGSMAWRTAEGAPGRRLEPMTRHRFHVTSPRCGHRSRARRGRSLAVACRPSY